MNRPRVFVALDRTPRILFRLLDSFDESGLEGLPLFDKFHHTLIGGFALCRQTLGVSRLSSALRIYLLYLGIKVNQLYLTLTIFISIANHVFPPFWFHERRAGTRHSHSQFSCREPTTYTAAIPATLTTSDINSADPGIKDERTHIRDLHHELLGQLG